MNISGCPAVSEGGLSNVFGFSEALSCASTYFEILMHGKYVEEKADVIDDLVFDVLLAAEEGELDLLQERINKLKNAGNIALTLETAKCIATGPGKQDKVDWINTKLNELNVTLEANAVFNKRLEQVDKKGECKSSWWKTAVKCAILVLVVLSGAVALYKMVQSPHTQTETCGLKVEMPKPPICSIDMVTGHNLGNTREDTALNLAIGTQRRYAEQCGHVHEVFSENRATGCANLQDEIEECDQGWSKIAIIRNWLQQPKNPCEGESWLAWLDPSVVVTNCLMKEAKLGNIIGDLREAGQVSMIMTSSTPFFGRPIIDTSTIFVRHDDAAKKVIERIWEARNDRADERTSNVGCGPERRVITDLWDNHPELFTEYFRNHPERPGNPLEWPDNTTVFVIPYRFWPIPGIGVPANSEYDWEEAGYWRNGDFSGRCLPDEMDEVPLACVRRLVRSSEWGGLC